VPELPLGADPVPATPIGDMREWHLHIQCGRCWREVVLPLGSLAERLGGRVRVAEIIRRLRCDGFRGRERCLGTPKRVILVRVATYGKTSRKLREIVVMDRSRRP
jgi:hypothetical protein